MRYRVHVLPQAWGEIKELPGNLRHRVRDAINLLETNPRPSNSKQLSVSSSRWEIRRVRLDKWRIIYGIDETENSVDVLALRKRPPYDYGDLEALLSELE